MPVSDLDQHDDDLAPGGIEPDSDGGDLVPAEVADDAADDAAAIDPSSRRRRPFDWTLWIASLPIGVGALLIAWGVSASITGDEVTKLPSAIESISPSPDAVQVLAQTNIVVDLAEGYEGRLTVDGVEFPTRRLEDFSNPDVEPGTQIDIPAGVLFEAGNDTLTFTPGPDIEITTFTEGNHTVRVVYWRNTIGDAQSRSYTWTFNVV